MRKSENQPHRLAQAESASLILSAIGTISAGLFNQAIFAAAPLTLALSLNFINRQRLLAQTRENTNNSQAAIANLQRQLGGDIDSVQSQVRRLPAAERIKEMEESMVRLAVLWSNLQERFQQAASPSTDPKIQEEFMILRRAIVRLRDSMNDNFSQIQQNFNEEIQSLRQELAVPVQQLDSSITESSNEIVATTPVRIVVSNEIGPVQAQIDELKNRLEELEQTNKQVVKPYLKRLVTTVKQLQQQSNTETITTSLTELITQLENLTKELENQIEPQQINPLHTSLSRISENLAFSQRNTEVETQPVRSLEG